MTRNRLSELVAEFGNLDWVHELDAVGQPVQTDARALQLTINDIDRQLRNLERERDTLMATVRELWKPREIAEAKRRWHQRTRERDIELRA